MKNEIDPGFHVKMKFGRRYNAPRLTKKKFSCSDACPIEWFPRQYKVVILDLCLFHKTSFVLKNIMLFTYIN